MTFTESSYPVEANPVAVASADLNGDGYPDFVTANYNASGTVSVMLNKGDGTFLAGVSYAVGTLPDSVAIADVNGDGHPDLLVANETDTTAGTFSVLLNKGDGTFDAAVSYAAGPLVTGIVAADFNGDGAIDVAMASPMWYSAVVAFNDGKGGFGAPVTYPIGGIARDVTAADFDGDGSIDLAVAKQSNGTSGAVTVLFNKGYGTFNTPVELVTGGTFTISVTHADVNGDGAQDLVAANVSSNQVTVFLNDGKGGFGAAANYGASTPIGIAAGDMNQDGHVDLLVLNAYSDLFTVLPNNGDGTFGDAQTTPTGNVPSGIAVADIDGDGDPDVAFGNKTNGTMGVAKNGTFAAPAPFSFTAVTGAAPGAIVDSEMIGISGGAGPIFITGGTYSVNYGPFTSAAGIVHDGDKVQVRATASSLYATQVDAVLTVAGVKATFSVTTADAPAGSAAGGGGGGLDLAGALVLAALVRRRKSQAV